MTEYSSSLEGTTTKEDDEKEAIVANNSFTKQTYREEYLDNREELDSPKLVTNILESDFA